MRSAAYLLTPLLLPWMAWVLLFGYHGGKALGCVMAPVPCVDVSWSEAGSR